MLFPARHRFHPRSQQDRERQRRHAALLAQIADLSKRIELLEKEQKIQFKRIADLQAELEKRSPR